MAPSGFPENFQLILLKLCSLIRALYTGFKPRLTRFFPPGPNSLAKFHNKLWLYTGIDPSNVLDDQF